MGSEGGIPVGSEGIPPAGAAAHEVHQRSPVMLSPSLPSQALRLSHKGMVMMKGKGGGGGGKGRVGGGAQTWPMQVM